MGELRKAHYASRDGRLLVLVLPLEDGRAGIDTRLVGHAPVRFAVGSRAYALRLAREKVRGYDRGNPAEAFS